MIHAVLKAAIVALAIQALMEFAVWLLKPAGCRLPLWLRMYVALTVLALAISQKWITVFE